MSKQDPASTIESLLKRAKATPVESPAITDGGADPVGELVFSFLLWEAPFTRARAAFKRVTDATLDHNDLRVTRPDDLADMLGKTYPLVTERCERLLYALDQIYRREYRVVLDGAIALGKREGRKYLESIDDVPPFVSARTSLVAMGSHAVPLDERTLSRLIETEVFEAGTTLESAQGTLERRVKASDAQEFHERMVDWMDKPASAPRRTTKKKTKKKATSRRR